MRINKALKFGNWEFVLVLRGSSFFSITLEELMAERCDSWEVVRKYRLAF